MKTYGVIGYPLEHSYSPEFFTDKFRKEKIEGVKYEAFPLRDISEFPELLKKFPEIRGLNVTIPFKESVIKFLDELDPDAERTGAVNTICIDHMSSGTQLTGYNTDIYGFKIHIQKIIQSANIKALIIGSGGASKAVKFVLDSLRIESKTVSRNPSGNNQISYEEITSELLASHQLIVNTTPLGMFPDASGYPQIPYQYLNPDNILYDLVYNPARTNFLKFGENIGAKTFNGESMFVLQAERSWEIWNKCEVGD